MTLSQIRQDADRLLKNNNNHFRNLVLFHWAITAGASLLLMLFSALSQYIAPEGGLSNMQTQTLISTGLLLLRFFCIIAAPLWDAGLIYAALRLVRCQDSHNGTLLEGFRRFFPITVSFAFRFAIYFATCLVCYFASSIIMSILPLPQAIYDELMAFVAAPSTTLSDGIRSFMMIFMAVFSAALCVVLVPKLYLHRQTIYRIMDSEPCDGFQSVLYSRNLMKGSRRKLLVLDLSFWWFYLAELAISALSMGNIILPELGITLPISSEAAVWIFPIIALLAQLALYVFAKPRLAAAYALFYERVCASKRSTSDATDINQL